MADVQSWPAGSDPGSEAQRLDQAAETFKTLLMEILGHVRILQQRNMDHRLYGGLAAIERAAQEGSAMASQILEAPQTWSGLSLGATLPPHVPPARILLAGDPDALGGKLPEILRQQGHQVEIVHHPHQALAILRADDVDLLFTDLGTPDCTGWELASRARVIRPGLPVILVTRYAPQLDRERLQAMGVARILSRPYRSEDIAQVVAANVRPMSRAA